jgi:rhodanese-related sulfurtransferase
MRALTIVGAILALLVAGCEDGGGDTGDPQPQPAATGEVAEAEQAPEQEATDEEEAPITELEVTEVATLIESGDCVPVDANNPTTRERYGTIPGATLLTSSGRYDPSAELPEDHATKLVFYCGNVDCRASDGAADRARQAGYTDVNVMRAGIAGWVEAGKDTAPAS